MQKPDNDQAVRFLGLRAVTQAYGRVVTTLDHGEVSRLSSERLRSYESRMKSAEGMRKWVGETRQSDASKTQLSSRSEFTARRVSLVQKVYNGES